MAFCISCDFDRIQSYAQAVKTWDKGVIFPTDRKSDSAWRVKRGLVNVRKKHLTIQWVKGDIVLRLYDFPVVTWREDNSFTLREYNSRSTAVFANYCTPVGVFVSSGRYFTVTVDGRTYKVADKITFRERDGAWKADTITPWSVPRVNRERAKQALQETNYKEFRLWLGVYLQMASPSWELYPAWTTDDMIVDMVRGRKWRELVVRFPTWSADAVLNKVRQAIYHKYDCIEQESKPFLG